MTSAHPAGIGRSRITGELHDQSLICPVFSGVATTPRPFDPPEWYHLGIAARVGATHRAASRYYSRQPGGVSPLATPTGRV